MCLSIMEEIDKDQLKFRDCTNFLISGCTQSGKSTFVKRLLTHSKELFITNPEICLFSYSHWQPAYNELQQQWGDKIVFMEDLPKEEYLRDTMKDYKHGIFVADDKATQIPESAFFMDLLTRYGHHFNLSNVMLVQDPSLNGKMKSVLSKNFHVNVLMKSPRDRNYVRNLAIMLNDYKCLTQAYDDATKEKYGYLVIDLHPQAEDRLKYRSFIFPDDQHTVVYRAI